MSIFIILLSCFLCANAVENWNLDQMEYDLKTTEVRSNPLYKHHRNDYIASNTNNVYRTKKEKQKLSKDMMDELMQNAVLLKEVVEEDEEYVLWAKVFRTLKCLTNCLPDQFVKKSLEGKMLLNYLADKIIQITRNNDRYDFEQISQVSRCVSDCMALYTN